MAAVSWQLTSLARLNLNDNKLTSLPAEILRLTSLEELGPVAYTHLTLPTSLRVYISEVGG